MQVDWITVTAQIINFLILVWLLKHFLYGRIVKAMDAREAQIADRIHAAESKQKVAGAEAVKYREMQQNLNERRDQLLREAQAKADELRKSLQSDARQEVATLKETWISDLAQEKSDFLNDVRERSSEAFSHMARRALADLANAELEDQIVRRFTEVLQQITDKKLEKLKALSAHEGAEIVVRTNYDLSTRRRNETEAAIREMVSDDAKIVFERTREIVCGMELRIGGQLVRWSLDSFLDGMERDLREELEAHLPLSESKAAE